MLNSLLFPSRFVVNIYSCPVRLGELPFAVSLVRQRCDPARNVLAVTESTVTPAVMFTVCVAPLHDNYDDPYQLVDMVETNRILGANRFVFYNHSSSSVIQSYLKQYVNDGTAEVISWDLPVARHSTVDIYYHGQLAAYSDCLYRSLYGTRYIVFLDLDEVIVPRKSSNWADVLRHAATKDALPVCAFSFRNAFFRTEWPSDDRVVKNATICEFRINSLLKSKREKTIYPHLQRSKCIYDVRYLEIPGIHQPWKCLEKSLSYHVTPREGLLHHYRSWQEPDVKKWVLDRTLHRYQNRIFGAVRKRHDDYSKSRNTI